MKRLKWWLAAGVLLATGAGAEPPDVGDLFTDPGIWALDAEAFTAQYGALRFRWTSREKRQCRSTDAGELMPGVSVAEVLVDFADGVVNGVTCRIYNRGDSEIVSTEKFQALGRTVTKALSELTGDRPRPVRQLRATGIRRQGLQWVREPNLYRLVWSYTTRHGEDNLPEYLHLVLRPAAKAGGTLGDRERPPTPLELRQSVVKRDNGDVILPSVPMVDQGQKGYCAVAVMERLLRYFGRKTDQHELAQMAGTGQQRGTDPNSLKNALRKFSGQFKIHVQVIEEFDMGVLRSMISDYNREVRRSGGHPIELPKSGVIQLDQIYALLDPEVFVRSKSNDHTGMRNFEAAIHKSIETGLPLVWSVMLGIVAEPRIAQAAGGHMRLIIGFNREKDEVLFSDTWGAGHEEKRMRLAEAFAITTNLYAVKPR